MDKSDKSDCSRWRDEYLYCLMDDSDYSQSPHCNLSTPFFAPTYSVDKSCSRRLAHEDDFHRGYQGEESRVNSYECSKSNDETDESQGFFTLAIPQPASTRYFQPEEIDESERSRQRNTDEEESCYRLMDDSEYSQSPHYDLRTRFFGPTRGHEDEYQGEESRAESYEDNKSNDETEESQGSFTSTIPQPAMTRYFQHEEILGKGLCLVGFNRQRQLRVNANRNLNRFKSFFGVGPKVLSNLFNDLREKNDSFCLTGGLMVMDWLKSYDRQHRMAGRWGLCEETIGPKLRLYAQWIQSLKSKKIRFEGFNNDDVFWISVDGVHFETEEFRLDPSKKYYSHKKNSAGLVS